MFRKEGANWVRKKRTETVNFVEEDYPSDEDDDEEDFEYDMGRVLGVNKLGNKDDPTYIRITLSQDAEYRSRVPWTTDSGVCYQRSITQRSGATIQT